MVIVHHHTRNTVRLFLVMMALLLSQCTVAPASDATDERNPPVPTTTPITTTVQTPPVSEDERIPATPTTRTGIAEPLATPKPRIDTDIVKPSETPKMLRFVRQSLDEAATCVAFRIQGIDTTGWRVTIDGLKLAGPFAADSTTRICGLRAGAEFTFTVRDASDTPVAGGAGIPARDTAIMVATWE